jgi:hypothetical protein
LEQPASANVWPVERAITPITSSGPGVTGHPPQCTDNYNLWLKTGSALYEIKPSDAQTLLFSMGIYRSCFGESDPYWILQHLTGAETIFTGGVDQTTGN